MNPIIQNIKNYIRSPIGLYSTVMVGIWLFCWYMNGAKGTHFDLNSLQNMYIWVFGQMNAHYAVDSIFNSPQGVIPNGTNNNPKA